jgi:hypothetical protein
MVLGTLWQRQIQITLWRPDSGGSGQSVIPSFIRGFLRGKLSAPVPSTMMLAGVVTLLGGTGEGGRALWAPSPHVGLVLKSLTFSYFIVSGGKFRSFCSVYIFDMLCN